MLENIIGVFIFLGLTRWLVVGDIISELRDIRREIEKIKEESESIKKMLGSGYDSEDIIEVLKDIKHNTDK